MTFKRGYRPWNKGRKFTKAERRKFTFIDEILRKNPAIERKRVENTKKAYLNNPALRKKISRAVKKAFKEHPASVRKISLGVRKFWREHPEINRKRALKIKEFYKKHPHAADKKNNPELIKKIDKSVTEWWRNHPNIRRERSKELREFFINNPEEFERKFLKGKKNPFRAQYKAPQGFKVRSNGELKIATFLFSEGIAAEYESEVLVLDGWACVPDFFLSDYGVYIEYYGGFPGSRNKKVIKNKLYGKYSVPVISVTPAEMGDLDAAILRELRREFGKESV